MIALARAQAQLARSAAEVFAYVADLRHFGGWFPGVLAIEARHPGGEPGPDAVYRETVRLPLRGATAVGIRVREFVPGQRLVTEGDLAPVWPRMQIEVRAQAADRCALSWQMHSRSHRASIRLLSPLLRRVMQRRGDAAMTQLQQRFGAG